MSSRVIQSLLFLNNLKKIPLAVEDIDCLFTTKSFKSELLKQISAAKKRIYLAALYLEDDQAGEEVLSALYQAKKNNPSLDIVVCVDFHRAQRGLIGVDKSASTNATWYQQVAKIEGLGVKIIGIPVKRKELFGVQHLKGFIFDDQVLYSGASLNNIYLHQQDKYRLDRYWLIKNQELADSLVRFLQDQFLNTNAVASLNTESIADFQSLKLAHKTLIHDLRTASYQYQGQVSQDQLTVTPLFGLGARKNQLNKTIRQIFQSTEQELILFTPYFNLPSAIVRDINALLTRGVQLTIIVGDKTANDFYIPADKPFKTIGTLPYLYESNIKKFATKNQPSIDKGLLKIHLWKDKSNSFHLKGLYSDNRFAMLTGHNLNPRAWRLDLENALLIDDPKQEIKGLLDKELSGILANTRKIKHFNEIEDIANYPENVKKILIRMRRFKADRLVKGLL
ncbi:CDP-diacylglycerol--serine O-phosphatidyltransferase [Psychromonas ingrahamii 37]|uniref:CDP-diacylglycerol--serine O-phosphatidyltransferase n=1 Tax=Psychromonas ingrahamii (strain DSM 17664 / CCUG 51855 / 37) TaxID=357804 RepID=A1SW78_PSYIN|nr:CDP-diacylglycerol--serine O-phosphatidyltransferase [Psychromonas ingrahamii]ABM03743.1 CDP-diacylglycerol--serine O-phosphatidyltransferase [Psychromonas ingrahamii 37]